MLALLLTLLLNLGLAQELEIHFIDVGQGDSVLIRSPSGQTALYDGGDRGTAALNYLRDLGVEALDLVIASHAHADHIGGLVEVVRAYPPRFFMDNGIPHTTRTYQDLLEAVDEAGSQYLEATSRRIGLGEVSLEVLPPPGEESWGHNDNSVGILIHHGAFSAALTGDAEERLFHYWNEEHAELLQPMQVYKSSHHGSRNGDTPLSMERFNPEVVVIGVGEGNDYGHPHEEALLLYASVGAEVYRTDLHGSVVIRAREDGSYEVSHQRAAPTEVETEALAAVPSCVDINTADAERLQEIIHVGPDFAQQILELRPFNSVDELTRVRGIGEGRLNDIRKQGLACVGEGG
jgi:beta-lactamase superfamily II metal-dependent hydrolase